MEYQRQQNEIQALKFWPLLRGNLWHATSVLNARGILEAGAIRNDLDRAGYKQSFCRVRGGISLFDFSERLEKIASQADNWFGWFGSQSHIKGKAVVWFRLDRDVLGDAVKSVTDTLIEWRATGYPMLIPFVEVCHRGSIPASAITGALVISVVDRAKFKFVEAGDSCWSHIERFDSASPELPPPSAFELALRRVTPPHKD